MPAKAPSAPAPSPEIYDGVDEETVVEPKPAPQPKAETKPTHHPRIAAMALDIGMSQGEIDTLDPDRLADIVYHVNKRTMQGHKQQAQINAQQTDHDRAKTSPEPAPVVEDEFNLDPADYDPKVFALLKRQNDEIKSLKGLKDEVKSFHEREEQREMRTLYEVLDDTFDGMEEGYDKFLGKGSVAELTDPVAKKRRLLVIQAAEIKKGMTQKQVAQRIKAAATEMFGPAVTKPAPVAKPSAYDAVLENAEVAAERPALAKDPETGRFLTRQQTEQIQADLEFATQTARPTHRAGANEPNGPEKAKRNLAARLKDRRPDDGAETGHATKEDFL